MSGHGHVVPNADGSRVRCGGPGFCAVCSAEAVRLGSGVVPPPPPPVSVPQSHATTQAHRCPVCEGRGTVPQGFYLGTGIATQNATVNQPCLACDETGVLWR